MLLKIPILGWHPDRGEIAIEKMPPITLRG